MIRYSYSDSEVSELEIHPSNSFEKELVLAKEFVESCNLNGELVGSCPFSGKKGLEKFFTKWGVDYSYCPVEWNLSVTTPIPEDLLHKYFFDSELAAYRSSEEYQKAGIRERVWSQLIEWMEGRFHRYGFKGDLSLLDYGTKSKYWPTYLEKNKMFKSVDVKSPLPSVREKIDCGTYDAVTMVDVIQRSTKPSLEIENACKNLKPGGLLILTCRSGAGFDVISLREFSKSIYPFEHMSLPSPVGINNLLQKLDFDVLEVITPGLLDLKYMKEMADLIPQDQSFQRYILSLKDEKFIGRFQDFIQQNNLSSHIRVVARKKGN